MSVSRDIPVNNLLVDQENPRMEPQPNQREAIRALVVSQGTKVINLADDIVKYGLSPADRFIVMPTDDDKKHFIVLDGNRRLTALKLLNEPELAAGIIRPVDMQKLKQLAKRFENDPITYIRTEVFDTREEAAPWIERRHSTEMEGIGLVSWGRLEKQHFATWLGKRSPALQVIEFVREYGNLDESTKGNLAKIAISNLERLIDDLYVREKLGIERREDQILTRLPNEEVVKGLQRIIADLVGRRINVTHIERKADRKKYIDKFDDTDLPNLSTANLEPHLLGETAQRAQETDEKQKHTGNRKSRGRRSKKPRVAIIPRTCTLNINDDRLNNIYLELKSFSADEYPNAAAVLLRVFIELSVDDYIERHNIIEGEQQRRRAKLSDRLSKVADFMKDEAIMTEQELFPVTRAASPQHLLAASITTFHQFIHNRHFSPIPSELRTAWDDLQPFMERIWQ